VAEPETEEDRDARRLLLDKSGKTGGDDLSDWGKNALPVAIELRAAPPGAPNRS